MASDKTEAKDSGSHKKQRPSEHKTPSRSNLKDQRGPASPRKILQKCALQEGLRSSGYSKLSGNSTSAFKHPKTIEATAQHHK